MDEKKNRVPSRNNNLVAAALSHQNDIDPCTRDVVLVCPTNVVLMEIVSTTYTTTGGRVREHIRLFRSVYVVVRIFGKTPAVTVSEFRNGGAAVKNRVQKFISVLAPVNVRTTITTENACFRERTPSKFRYSSPSWTLENAIFENKSAPIRLCLERFDLGGIRILNKTGQYVCPAVTICVVSSGF